MTFYVFCMWLTDWSLTDGDSGHERGGKKELLRSKKKDKKDKNKDKGYAALGEDSSPDEMDQSDTKWVLVIHGSIHVHDFT